MAANNRKRGAVKPDSARQVPGWVWLFTGVVTGLFIAFLVHLGQLQQDKPGQSGGAESTAKDAGTDPQTGDDKPSFDFYAVLPKMEVIVPKGEDEKTQTGPDNTAGTDGDLSHRHDETYMLQAGSFRTAEDADRRRAELILQGYDVKIQTVELDSGDSWHRVMVGPFNNKNRLHRAQDKLAAGGIETLPIKQKQQ